MAYLNLAMAPPLVAVGKLPLRNESNKVDYNNRVVRRLNCIIHVKSLA